MRKPRRRRRVRRWKRGGKALNTARAALRVAKSVRGKIETKYAEISAFDQSVTAFIINILPNINQGAHVGGRIGQEISLKSIVLNLHFKKGATTFNTKVFSGRLLLIKDTRPNNALFTAADILASPTRMESPYKISEPNERGRFQIIFDKVINIGTTQRFSTMKLFFNKKLGKVIFKPGQAGGQIAEIEKGSICLMWVVGSVDSTNDKFDWYSRVRFTDA